MTASARTDALGLLRSLLSEQLATLRGVEASALPAPLLDVTIRRCAVGAREVYVLRPADWEALRDEEGAAGRPIPYWARAWPSGLALAAGVAADPPAPGARVLELGCGLAVPSVFAARAGADVLATDGAPDAVAFAAHVLALNDAKATVAHADWQRHGALLLERGPFDLVMAADVLYTRANVETALRLLPRLVDRDGELRLADPGRAGTRDFLAAARASFRVTSSPAGAVTLYRLRPR